MILIFTSELSREDRRSTRVALPSKGPCRQAEQTHVQLPAS